jgi:CO/xanthine dehydrogenase FAD-binding subunit
MPLDATGAAGALVGEPLGDDVIGEAAGRAAQQARPMDNTDFSLHWRKQMVRRLVACALRELRGDDVRDERRKISRLASLVP